ncbi:coq9 [Scenedesmus sp. PABB004]|nr:coq9 [Scenedesmus sp. PABB004]
MARRGGARRALAALLLLLPGLSAAAAAGAALPREGDVLVLSDDTFDSATATGVWLIDIYAPWCSHCQQLEPAWHALASEMAAHGVKVAKVDGMRNRVLMKRFGVTGFPSIYLLRGGQTWQYAGMRSVPDMKAFALGGYKAASALPFHKAPNSLVGRAVGILHSFPSYAKAGYEFLRHEKGLSDGAIVAGVLLVPLAIGAALLCALDALTSSASVRRAAPSWQPPPRAADHTRAAAAGSSPRPALAGRAPSRPPTPRARACVPLPLDVRSARASAGGAAAAATMLLLLRRPAARPAAALLAARAALSNSTVDGDSDAADVRAALLEAALPHVQREGWTAAALRAGARDLGLSPAAAGVLPRGPADLVLHVIAANNAALAAELAASAPQLAALPVRARVAAAVRRRLELNAPFAEAWPAALALAAAPAAAPRALELLSELVDAIWHAAGDTSTDYNWYTKRALLAGIYTATELYMLTDYSPGYADTWAQLERRVADALWLGGAVGAAAAAPGRLAAALLARARGGGDGGAAAPPDEGSAAPPGEGAAGGGGGGSSGSSAAGAAGDAAAGGSASKSGGGA